MAHGGYEYESGGLMPMIRALVKPPDELVSHPKPKKPLHPYYKRPGKGHNHDCCDACNEGGDLICCDRCPASFHLMCYDPPLEQEDIPAGMWLCKTCRTYDVDSDGNSRAGSPHRTNKRIRKRGNSSGKAKEKKNKKKKAEARKKEAKKEKLRLEEARKLEIKRQCTSLNTGDGSNPDTQKMTAMDLLVKAASMMNPAQFDLPGELKVPVTFPGTEKGKPRPVPANMKECYACRDHLKKAPLIACDYCDCFFHQDCLNPPLTALPIGRWMCPNHVEHYVDSKMLSSISLTERTALWEKWGGPIDEQAIKTDFLRRGRDVNRMFRLKVEAPSAPLEEVPVMVRQHYFKPPSQLPSRKEYSRSARVLKNLKSSGTYNESDEEANMDEQTKPRICLSLSCPANTGTEPCPYEGSHSQDDRASPLITEQMDVVDEETPSLVLEEDEESGPVVTAKEYKAPHSFAPVQQQNDGPCPMDTEELKEKAVNESISEKDVGYENEFLGEESTVHYQKSIGEEDSDQDIEYVTQEKSTTCSKSAVVDIADCDIEFVSQDVDEYPKDAVTKDSSDVATLDDGEDVHQHQKSSDVEDTAQAVEFVSQDVGVRYQKPIGVENIGDGVEFVVGADGVHYQKPFTIQDTTDDVRLISAGDASLDNEFVGDEDAVHYQKSIGDEDAEEDIEFVGDVDGEQDVQFVGDEEVVHYQETIGDDDPDNNIEIVKEKDAEHYYELVEEEEDEYETERASKDPAVYYQERDEEDPPAYEDEGSGEDEVVYYIDSTDVEEEDENNQVVGDKDVEPGVKHGAEEEEQYEEEFVGDADKNSECVGEKTAAVDDDDEFYDKDNKEHDSKLVGGVDTVHNQKSVGVKVISHDDELNEQRTDQSVELLIEEQVDDRDKLVHDPKKETDGDAAIEYDNELVGQQDTVTCQKSLGEDNAEREVEFVGDEDAVHYQESIGDEDAEQDLVIIGEQDPTHVVDNSNVYETVAAEKENRKDRIVGEEGQENAQCEGDVDKQDVDRARNAVSKEYFDQDSEYDAEDEEAMHDTEDESESDDSSSDEDSSSDDSRKSVGVEDSDRDRAVVGEGDMECDSKLVGEGDAEPDRAKNAENKKRKRSDALSLSDNSDSELEERIRKTVRKRRAVSAASRRGRALRAFSARKARAAAAGGAGAVLLTRSEREAVLRDAEGRLLGLERDLVRVLAWQRMLQIALVKRVYAPRPRGSDSSERSYSPERWPVAPSPPPPPVLPRADRERVAAAVWGPRPAPPAAPAHPRLELRNALIKASLVRVSTRPGTKISVLGSPLAMRKSSLTIGTESNSDLVLDPSCRCVSPLHAVIFYDEVTSHFEMLNYSEWGSSVNGVLYACDTSAAQRGEDPESPEGRAEARAALLRDLVKDRMPPEFKLNVPLTVDPEYSCQCEPREPVDACAWEGPALIAHGALVQFGCYRFVFSVTGASWRSRAKALAADPPL